jgi:hypothetical protein
VCLACEASWQRDEVLGVEVEWPGAGPRPYRELARAVCDASEDAPDPRLLNGARVRVVAAGDVEGECLSDRAAACWHPDPDDADGPGLIIVGPPGDGGQFSGDAFRHEVGHLARQRWRGDADSEHADAAWWSRFDGPAVCE